MNSGYYFKAFDISNPDFGQNPLVQFDFPATKILVTHDSTQGLLEFSWNGRDLHGQLEWEDEMLSLSNMEHSIGRLWFKTDAPVKFRVYAWA